MNLNSIPAFDDNYIWVLNDEAGRCLIVDPGDAEPDYGWVSPAHVVRRTRVT